MPSVQRYLEATDQSPIANAYFLEPILRTVANLVRPPTRRQKFFRREVAFPCPPAVWERFSHFLPTVDTRLGIKRAESYEGLFGKLKPTRETATARIYRYDVPAAHVSVIEDLVTPAMKKHFSSVSSGGARLGRVRKAQFKRGVRATCITMPTEKKTDVRLFDNCHDGDRGRPIARPGGPEPPSPSTCPLADLLGTPPLPTGRDNNCARAQDTAGALHTRIALLLTVCTAGVCPEVRPGQRPEVRTSTRMFVCLYPCRRMFVGRETSLLPSSAPRGAAGDKNQTANAALP